MNTDETQIGATPRMTAAWDAFERRACGWAYVRHQSLTVEAELHNYRVKCHEAIRQAALQSAELAEWKACAERLAESLMANMRHNNNFHGHACTVGTREAHDEFLRLKGSPLTPALSPHPMKGAGEEPSP